MLAPPPGQRRRLIGPGHAFAFIVSSRLFDLPAHVWQTRLVRVLQIAYNMSYNFRTQRELRNWTIQNAQDLNIIQNWLSDPIPLIPVDDTVINMAWVNLMTSFPVNFFNNNYHHVMTNLTLQIGPRTLGMPDSTEIYVTRNGTGNTNVSFWNVPIELLQSVVDYYHGAQIDIANSRLASAFRRTYDDLVQLYARLTSSTTNGFLALASAIQNYQININVLANYHDNLITLYGPARYYIIGFGVIGPNLMEQSPVPLVSPAPLTPFSYVLTPGIINQIQVSATITPPPSPFGPGALAWLLLGVEDYLQNILVRNRNMALQMVANQQINLVVTVNFVGGASMQYTFPLSSGLITVHRPSYYTARAKFVFSFVSQVFAGFMRDYYKDQRENDDRVKPVIHDIVLTVNGVAKRTRITVGSGIDGNNIFWENLLVPGDGRFTGFKRNFVLFKSRDDTTNTSLHGCVQRAVNCTCKINDHDSVVFCNCPPPECLESVDLETTKVLCRSHGDKFLIFVITISKADQRGHTDKSIELVYKGSNYYSDPDGKVLYISMPQWTRVQGHCALWLPSEYNGSTGNKEYGNYLAKSRFNTINEKITRKDEPFYCPICADIVNKDEIWGHFLRHNGKNVCISCGLDFETEELLNVHTEYHCKQLPLLSTIVLRSDPIVYHEPTEQGLWICVYADLESAILPSEDGVEREHKNILVGWVDDYNKEVRVARDIKEFLNSLAKLPTTDVIVYFHNGEGYDFHFIVRDLCDCRKGFVKNFSIVGDSGQKIRFFSVSYRGKQLHFRDSYAFVSESLEKWVKSSVASGCEFPCFNNTFDEHKKTILLRKNPFPYNAITSASDLDRPIADLYFWAISDINEELFCYKYSKEELTEFAGWLKDNYEKCKWKTVLDYYIDYLKCDVSQLKDVMDYFASNAEREFKMNIHCYYGTPSLTWAAWLKQNKFKLSPITDPRHYDVINSTIRGGQTGVFTRLYEQQEEGGAMFDLDCNALYATVMLKFEYPCHDWREEDIPEIGGLLEWIGNLHKSGRSAFVELDLTVPESALYNDYVPIASKRLIRGVYNYEAMRFYDTENPQTMFFNGLTQVVGEHKHYCCHTRNLEWYLKHAVIIVNKIHFILSGEDEPVFREYVQDKLDKRKKYAADPIKKMLYKLLNNSLYGKTYEDETQRAEYCLEPKEKVDPEDKHKVRRIVTEMNDWVLYEHVKTQFVVNKPVYLGACITEFSKLWMYQFYYDRIKIHYPDARVYYTDTDALTIFFPTKVKTLMDVANELNGEEQIIDTSNFDVVPTEDKHCKHNNEPGLFKSETGQHAIVKFIGLRAKTYIMVCENGDIKMSVKGCPMMEKKRLTWEDFKRVLFSKGEGYKIEFDAIRSKYHLVKSVRLSKIVLSADDRKRYILPDLIHTLPLFSKEHMEAIQE